MNDVPYLLRNPDVVEQRLRENDEPHMVPLTAYVHGLRERFGEHIPYFDPWDGGVEARILMLLEAPGGKAVGSGFVSMNNPDPTARTVHETIHRIGLGRRELVIWNIVPWYVGDEERKRIRAVNSQEREVGVELLQELLPLLPHLKIILTLGTHARAGWMKLASRYPQMDFVAGPHPSATNLNSRSHLREEFESSLRAANALVC